MPLVIGRSGPGRLAAFGLQALGFIGFSQALPRMQIPVTLQGSASGTPDVTGTTTASAKSSTSPSQAPSSSVEVANKGISFQARCPFDFRADEVSLHNTHTHTRTHTHALSLSLTHTHTHTHAHTRIHSQVSPDKIHNLDRVSRHPMLWSLALAGAGTALRTLYVSEAVMFAFPTIFALVGGAHQDYRYRRGSGGMLR
jgi:hypothetical protein